MNVRYIIVMSIGITPLFGHPVYQTVVENELNMAELTDIIGGTIAAEADKLVSNTGNAHTADQYFLDKYKDSVLNKTIKKHLNIYFHDVLMASDDIEIYVTQSWLNINKSGEFHHGHTHPNSFVSGTFYYQVDDKTGDFVCSANEYTPIEYEKKGYNILNSNVWKFTPKQYELFLFPSRVTHKVEANQSSTTRVSLAFNTYLRGVINRQSTTALILK